MDLAIAGKAWLNIVFHDTGASGNHVSQANFDALLAYLASTGVPVRNMGAVLTATN